MKFKQLLKKLLKLNKKQLNCDIKIITPDNWTNEIEIGIIEQGEELEPIIGENNPYIWIGEDVPN